MKIKICGITRTSEAEYLNECKVDYAGFVFYEKSKRNVTLEQAEEIMEHLHPDIRRVAVTVSPELYRIEELNHAGFDLLQVHGTLNEEMLQATSLPVWYAVNVADTKELLHASEQIARLSVSLQQKIVGIVVDGARYGGGKTFDWNADLGPQARELLGNRSFILAGGLNASNVQKGIQIFAPDIVDVSSGVEGTGGKDRALIYEFVRKVREHE